MRHTTPPPTLTSITVSGGSASVLVGSATAAFTATGHFDDGSMQVLSSGVVWASSDPTKATINGSGVATGVFHGSTNITASSGGSVTSTPAALAVIAILQSMAVTPLGPGILVSDNQQFAATGSFNDGSVSDVTSTASWSSSDITKATIDPASGLATGQAAGTVTVTAAAMAADGTPVSATTALNVVSSAYAALSGSYAFTLFSADTRGTAFAFGSLHVDGSGAIDGGEEDCNSVNGVQQNKPVSGTYFEYPDGRGQISLNANLCHPAGITLRFVLASGGNIGKLAQFDGLGTAKGTLESQTSTSAFGNASYVFRAAGVDSGSNSVGVPEPMGAVGQFNADGAGNITGGTIDVNDFGTVTTLTPLTASTYSSADANGRGTGQLSTAAGTTNFTFYVVTADKINFIQTDAAPATAVGGTAEVQDIPAMLGANGLFGAYSFLVGRPVIVNATGFDRTEFAQVGEYTFDGVGGPQSVAGVRDDTNNTVPNPLADLIGGFSFGMAAAGRGTFDLASPSQATDRFYICYALSTNGSGVVNRAFVLQTTNFAGGTRNAPTGEMDVQTANNAGALGGTYALDASELTASFSEALMALTVDGAGNVSGIADVSAPVNGTLTLSSNEVAGATYGDASPASAPNSGRVFLTLPNQIGFQNSIFYLISPQSAWALGTTPSVAAADGSLTQQ
ncbi:MAG: Ig-like domain-containing protein [Acidobacteriia bacterium]|nr:Ig-like domain-containing protein [Terriglobia bacterium]